MAHLRGPPAARATVSGRAPYVYSPLYEGGERTPGVFMAGETPDRQLLPTLRWMAGELGVRTWCVVGDDYVWPLASAAVARRFAQHTADIRILDEVFVPLGTQDFAAAVERVERSGADGVLMLLVGSDAVRFNRAFASPRGTVRMAGNHLMQSVYLARADGLDLDVVARLQA